MPYHAMLICTLSQPDCMHRTCAGAIQLAIDPVQGIEQLEASLAASLISEERASLMRVLQLAEGAEQTVVFS